MPRLIHLDHIPARSRRPAPEKLPPWTPGASARAVLGFLYRYRFLTSELLGMVYEADRGRGTSQVAHILTKLWRYGLVERFYRPAERGSTQYVYTVSVDGAHLVLRDDEWAAERRRIYNLARARRDYEHLLAISLLQVLWDLGSPAHEELFTTVAYWLDKEGDSEHVRNRFTVQLGKESVSVKPDTTVLVARRDFYRPVFFEIERTHKNLERTRRRFLVYEQLLGAQQSEAAAVFQRELDHVPMNGMAVFIAAHDRHVETLRTIAWHAIGAGKRSKSDLPDFWFLPLTALFEEDKDGREKIIPPADLFSRNLAVNLAGRRGRIVA